MRKKDYALDFRQKTQTFSRQFKRERYTLICESILVGTCGCIAQPHVHFVRLTYQYKFKTTYPYLQSYYIDYVCTEVPNAIKAIDDFHGDGLAEIVMMAKL